MVIFAKNKTVSTHTKLYCSTSACYTLPTWIQPRFNQNPFQNQCGFMEFIRINGLYSGRFLYYGSLVVPPFVQNMFKTCLKWLFTCGGLACRSISAPCSPPVNEWTFWSAVQTLVSQWSWTTLANWPILPILPNWPIRPILPNWPILPLYCHGYQISRIFGYHRYP